MTDKKDDKKIGAKGYLLPALVVAFSFLTIYTVTVWIPDMTMVKIKPSEYAMEYLKRDENGEIVKDKKGLPVPN